MAKQNVSQTSIDPLAKNPPTNFGARTRKTLCPKTILKNKNFEQ